MSALSEMSNFFEHRKYKSDRHRVILTTQENPTRKGWTGSIQFGLGEKFTSPPCETIMVLNRLCKKSKVAWDVWHVARWNNMSLVFRSFNLGSKEVGIHRSQVLAVDSEVNLLMIWVDDASIWISTRNIDKHLGIICSFMCPFIWKWPWPLKIIFC